MIEKVTYSEIPTFELQSGEKVKRPEIDEDFLDWLNGIIEKMKMIEKTILRKSVMENQTKKGRIYKIKTDKVGYTTVTYKRKRELCTSQTTK